MKVDRANSETFKSNRTEKHKATNSSERMALKPKFFKDHWVSFSSYFLVWLKAKGKQEVLDKINSVKVHELITSINFDPESKGQVIEGSKTDIKRTVFIEEDGCISFAFVCEEHGTQSISYVAYLEKYGDSKISMTCILQAYAEYVSLLAEGEWTLHIWADPPNETTGPSFFFRNKPIGGKTRTAEELKSMYKALLLKSGFSGSEYEWQPTLPPLPSFGKKNETLTKEAYQEMVSDIHKRVGDFNQKLFANTHCVVLKKPACFSALTLRPQVGKLLINDEYMCNIPDKMLADESLDFSTRALAIKSTMIVIKRMRSAAGKSSNYYGNDWSKLNKNGKNLKMIENYQSLIAQFKP